MKTYTDGKRQVNYGYNAENLRTYKTVNGKFTGYVWNGSNLAAETSDNAVTSTYTYGVGGIVSANVNGTTSLYLKNIHGDVIGITDIEGTMQKQYDYTAFGIEKDPEETDTNPFRYAGEFFDTETDNIYLRNRYYAPKLGRFLNEDTHWNTSNMIYGDREYKEDESKIPDIAAISQSKNLYIYCVNNPVMFVDFSGENATSTVAPFVPDISNIDGPYPYADFVAALILAGAVVIDGISYGINRVGEAWEAYKRAQEREKARIATQYNFAKANGQKAERHSNTKDNKKGNKSLPTKGKPNSSKDLLNPDGTVKQRRYYGPDGKAQKDIDYNHSNGDGSHEFPHSHWWDWSSGKGVRH